jgi:enoyl-CoA hydratase/carnithine racemase
VVSDRLRATWADLRLPRRGTGGLRATSRIINVAVDSPLPEALDSASLEFAGLLRHGAAGEGIAATRQKRAPAWQVAVPSLPDFT